MSELYLHHLRQIYEGTRNLMLARNDLLTFPTETRFPNNDAKDFRTSEQVIRNIRAIN